MQKKVMITLAPDAFTYSPGMTSKLEDAGFLVHRAQDRPHTPEEVAERLRGYNAAIVGMEPYTDDVLEQLAGDLRVLARFGIGYDAIDVPAATKRGIAVTNTPGRISAAVAEEALALLLGVSRNVCLYDRRMRAGWWGRDFVASQLESKTVGIVGFGSIGRRLASYLRGFGCRILAYDLAFDREAAEKLDVEQASLDDIASEADFISLHLPLTDETRGLIDARFLERTKDTAFLINTSRGGVVVEEDLVAALRNGVIAGAGLDVFEREPLPDDSPLKTLDNVVLTPHIASNTREAINELGLTAAESVLAVFAGNTPPTVVNPDFIRHRRID